MVKSGKPGLTTRKFWSVKPGLYPGKPWFNQVFGASVGSSPTWKNSMFLELKRLLQEQKYPLQTCEEGQYKQWNQKCKGTWVFVNYTNRSSPVRRTGDEIQSHACFNFVNWVKFHRRKTSDWSTRDHVTLPDLKWRQYLHSLFIPVERRLIAA